MTFIERLIEALRWLGLLAFVVLAFLVLLAPCR